MQYFKGQEINAPGNRSLIFLLWGKFWLFVTAVPALVGSCISGRQGEERAAALEWDWALWNESSVPGHWVMGSAHLLSCRRLLKMAQAEGIRVTAVAEVWNGRCHQGGDRHRGRDMVRHAGCLCGNKCSWTLKSGGTHQPPSTLVNRDSPQNMVATQKTLWAMIPGLCNLLRYIQGLLGSPQFGNSNKFSTESNPGIYCLMEQHSCAQEYAWNYRGSLGMQRDAELALHC